jgi:hypothetical protein
VYAPALPAVLVWLLVAWTPAIAQARAASALTPAAVDPTLWYVTRGAAATAYVLLTLSVSLGLAVSMRAFEGLARAWRIFDLH